MSYGIQVVQDLKGRVKPYQTRQQGLLQKEGGILDRFQMVVEF